MNEFTYDHLNTEYRLLYRLYLRSKHLLRVHSGNDLYPELKEIKEVVEQFENVRAVANQQLTEAEKLIAGNSWGGQ